VVDAVGRIDGHLLEEAADLYERGPGVFWVTDLTSPCLRRTYYNIVDPEEYSVSTLRVFEAGRVLEDYWVGLLRRDPEVEVLGTQVAARVDFGGFRVHGRADILTHHAFDGLTVHEVKTARSIGLVAEAKPEHLMQLQFYLNALGVERGAVDYIGKAEFYQGEGARCDVCFPVTRDDAVLGWFRGRGEVLRSALMREAPPEPSSGWICRYCLYRDRCKRGEEAS